MRLSYIQSGLLLLLLAAVQLALFGIFVDMMFDEKFIWGAVAWGGFLPRTPGNWRLLFLLRSLAVVAGIPLVAKILYPETARDLKNAIWGGNRKALHSAMLGGLCLFIAELSLAIAWWQIPCGVAIAFFLMYPTFAVVGAWKLWGYRPSQGRIAAMTLVAIGSLLVMPLPPEFNATLPQVLLGIGAGFGGGVAFASYLLLSYRGMRSLHPLPFSAIALGMGFVLSCFSLMLPIPGWEIQVEITEIFSLVTGSLAIGILTLVGYLLNHYGILLAGVSRGAIAVATAPAIAVLLGVFLLQNSLNLQQVLAFVLVILGGLVMATEAIARQDWYD